MLYNEKFHNLYRSPNIVRVIKTRKSRKTGHFARMEEDKGALKISTGKCTGKRTLGRPRLRLEDNIRLDLQEIWINTRNWVALAKDKDYWRALVNAGLILRVP